MSEHKDKKKLWAPHGLQQEVLYQYVRPSGLDKKIESFHGRRSRRANSRTTSRTDRDDREELDRAEQVFIDRLKATPIAQRAREPLNKTIFVSVRETEVYPDGDIVDGVYDAPGPGRMALTQQVLDSGEVKLVCGDYEVKPLQVFENLDVVSRAGEFMVAAIQVLNLPVPRGDAKNLEPLYALCRWWKDPNNRLPENCVWDGISPWIKMVFEQRELRIEQNPHAIELPSCFHDLHRELQFDASLTKAVLKSVRSQREHSRISLTDCEVIEPVVADIAYSAFRNGQKWVRACMEKRAVENRQLDKAPEPPNWFGFAFGQGQGLAQRELRRGFEGPRLPALPLVPGRKMLDQLKPSPSILTVEDAVVERFPNGRKPAGNVENQVKKLKKACDAFYETKASFATSRYYLTQQSLGALLPSAPTVEQRNQAAMGLQRAIDKRVWRGSHSAKGAGKSGRGGLVQDTHAEIARHLKLPVDECQPKHEWDQEVLGRLQVNGSLETTTVNLEAADFTDGGDHDHRPPRAEENQDHGLKRLSDQDMLQRLIDQAGLEPDELQAIRYRYGLDPCPPEIHQEDLYGPTWKGLQKLRNAARTIHGDQDDNP